MRSLALTGKSRAQGWGEHHCLLQAHCDQQKQLTSQQNQPDSEETESYMKDSFSREANNLLTSISSTLKRHLHVFTAKTQAGLGKTKTILIPTGQYRKVLGTAPHL